MKTNEIKVEFGEGVIEGLASISIDAKQEVDNMQPTMDQSTVTIGRLKKKIAKLQKQRDFFRDLLEHFNMVVC